MSGKPNLEGKKKVGIWIRVSTEEQAKGDSPEHHKARAEHYASAKGWDACEVYDLAGVSGKSVMEHAETKRMMADIRRGHISGLIFSKLARLARNTKELLELAEFFREHNADLISLQESIDTGSPAGRLFYTIIAAMAEWERSEIADRIKASIAIRAKLGKPISGLVSYGYEFRDGKVMPHPDEAPVRKLMYELFAENKRKKTTAKILNERGFRTRGGGLFTDTTVKRLITDTTAKGEHRTNYTRSTGVKKKWALKPEHEWVINRVEPIVSDELWERCNAVFEARKTTGIRPTKRAVHAFTGFVFCRCGGKMAVPSNSPKYVCAVCKSKIPIIDLDGVFRDELKNYLAAPERVSEYVRAASQTMTDKRTLLSTLKKELDKVKQEVAKAFDLYRSNALSADQFKDWFQPLDARKKAIDEEIARAEAEIAVLSIDNISAEQVMSDAHTLYDRWGNLDGEEKRKLVELLVKRITIGEDEVAIELCYLPSFEMMTDEQRVHTGASSSARSRSPPRSTTSTRP